MDKKQILIILGPTATGKTDQALKLAKQFDGELIACDSRQVYRGLDIGTGKLPTQNSKVSRACHQKMVKTQKFTGCWEIDEVKIWLYDVADPKDRFDVYQLSLIHI